MKAMVLAAGLGERLRPATNRVPKPLFPVLGVPVIVWVLRGLRAAGVTDAVVNLHHLPARVVRFLGKGTAVGVHIAYSDEPILLGTGGGLWAVRDFFSGEDAFLVHNGDVWHDWDLGEVVAAHRGGAVDATLALVTDPSQPEAHVVEVSGGRVVGIRGRPRPMDEPPRAGGVARTMHVFSGVSVHTPVLFEHLPEGEVSCLIERGVIPMLEAGRAVAGVVVEGTFCDIGTEARFLALQWDLLARGPEALFERRGMAPPREAEAGVWFLGEPDVRPGARLVPPVLACGGVRVESGAVVGPRAVVCDGAVIEGGARVEDAVVFPGVRAVGRAGGIVGP